MTTPCLQSWKTLLAGSLGVATVATCAVPNIAQAQQQFAQASGPVTSISQLSDVQPTDWAFQALQSLVERYGCIAGYPDRTYRGNRAMTRFEFAAGMNACLDRINELIAAGLADKVSREDLAVLQRLQEEFAAELAALQGRVDVLETDVAELQSQVFNPVTKLNVEVITAIAGSSLSEDRVVGAVREGFDNGVEQITFVDPPELVEESDQANVTLPYRVRMAFDASFTGNDRLRIRLEAEDAETDFFSGDPGFDFNGDNDTFELDDLYYQFRTFEDRLFVFVGANSTDADQVFEYSVPWEEYSNFADNPPATQDAIGNGTLGLQFSPSDQFSLAYAYTADDPQTVGEFGGDGGLFAGDTGHYVEVGFLPNDQLELYFQFGSTFVQDFTDIDFLSPVASNGDNFFNYFRGPLSDPSDLENPLTGQNFPAPSARINAFTFASNWEITPRVIFSGWVSFGNVEYNLISAPTGTLDPGDEDIVGWLAGFLFPDLFLEGSEGTVAFGQPVSGDDIESQPFVLDVNYGFPINEFITIRPGAYFVFNPNGEPLLDNDPTISAGSVEAIFSF